YLCLRRFGELEAELGPDHPSVARLAGWIDDTETGDRAELALPESDSSWQAVRSSSETRIGARCVHYAACYVTQARRRAAAADLVIVNHHLFFADLALRRAFPDAQVLPPHDAVVFDEAHQLEDVATEHFGIQLSSARFDALARDLGKHEESEAGA